jgi:surface antigen
MFSAVLVLGLTASLLAACATQPLVTTPRTYQGAGAGAAVGAGAGALIDSNNRWRGAVLGGALGALAGGTLTEISSRASREAAYENRTVAYQTADGFQRVEARPVKRAVNGCRTVQERVYQKGQLIQERTREVC